MNGNIPHIPIYNMMFLLLLILIPLGINWYLKTRLINRIIVAILRMIAQLILMGILLGMLFKWDKIPINILWFIAMISFAAFSVIRNTEIPFKTFFLPLFISFVIASSFSIIYINSLVLSLRNIFSAKFFVVMGGMLLGNSLRGNIISLEAFYNALIRNRENFFYRLSLGATLKEALLPYMREGLSQGLRPIIASMATMGIVFIPGMMTGQIISGILPIEAIKYQIMIMLAIFASGNISIFLTMIISTKFAFDEYGRIKQVEEDNA
jgi:putative ABC transport system permease protein